MKEALGYNPQYVKNGSASLTLLIGRYFILILEICRFDDSSQQVCLCTEFLSRIFIYFYFDKEKNKGKLSIYVKNYWLILFIYIFFILIFSCKIIYFDVCQILSYI